MTEVGTMGGPEVHNHQLEQETCHRRHVPLVSDKKPHWILSDKAFTEQCSGSQGERLLATDRWTETLIHLGDAKNSDSYWLSICRLHVGHREWTSFAVTAQGWGD